MLKIEFCNGICCLIRNTPTIMEMVNFILLVIFLGRYQQAYITDITGGNVTGPSMNEEKTRVSYAILSLLFILALIIVATMHIMESLRIYKSANDKLIRSSNSSEYRNVLKNEEITFLELFTLNGSQICGSRLSILTIRNILSVAVTIWHILNIVQLTVRMSDCQNLTFMIKYKVSEFMALANLSYLSHILNSNMKESNFQKDFTFCKEWLEKVKIVWINIYLAAVLSINAYFVLNNNNSKKSLEDMADYIPINILYNSLSSAAFSIVFILQMEKLCKSKDQALTSLLESYNILQEQFNKFTNSLNTDDFSFAVIGTKAKPQAIYRLLICLHNRAQASEHRPYNPIPTTVLSEYIREYQITNILHIRLYHAFNILGALKYAEVHQETKQNECPYHRK
ncbi:uncharacterized protein TRIADDRAFT_61560 [Trichoplax adhaerens]|uniref:Uncharacterized protein n=1 Tax=Trichoplax adhaerens TaxID=10228 RepID=B3SBC0_TRIAD|nr:predicted protein [Trichoplax adhaerens]EDV19978.1 predicted protein [Trichoplax adhaerens]|eukprot:XP_002117568.1 predicted protein [Trichoplax adhaerens]